MQIPFKRLPLQFRSAAAILVLILGVYQFIGPGPVVTLDGYSHLYNSFALKTLWASPDGPFREEYKVSSPLLPNWIGTLTLIALQTVFTGEASLKAMHALSFAFLLLSLLYLVWGIPHPSRFWPELICLLLPLSFSSSLILGFHGFTIGCALSFIIIGMLSRYGARPSLRIQCFLFVMLLMTYYAHAVCYCVAFMFFLAKLMGEFTGTLSRTRTKDSWLRFAVSQFLPFLRFSLGGLVPWLIPAFLAADFAWQQAKGDIVRIVTQPAGPAAQESLAAAHRSSTLIQHIGHNVTRNLLTLVQPDSFLEVAPSRFAGVLFICFCATLLVGSILWTAELLRARRGYGGAPFVLFLGGLLLLCVIMPGHIGEGSVIQMRLLYYTFVACALICIHEPGSQKRLLTVGVWLFAVPYMCCVYSDYRGTAGLLRVQVRELLSLGPDIEPNSRIAIMAYDLTPHDKDQQRSGQLESINTDGLIGNVAPQRHLASILAVERGSLVLNNFEGYTGVFPLTYRNETGRTVLGEYIPSRASEWRDFVDRWGDKADYIVVWGVATDIMAAARVTADTELRVSIQKKFCLIRETGRISRVVLYRRIRDRATLVHELPELPHKFRFNLTHLS